MRKVFTTKGQGRYGKTKNSLAMQEKDRGVDTRIHSDHVVVVRGWVLDTYLHDEGTGTVREVIEVVKGKTKGKRNRRSVERENENGVNQRLRR